MQIFIYSTISTDDGLYMEIFIHSTLSLLMMSKLYADIYLLDYLSTDDSESGPILYRCLCLVSGFAFKCVGGLWGREAKNCLLYLCRISAFLYKNRVEFIASRSHKPPKHLKTKLPETATNIDKERASRTALIRPL